MLYQARHERVPKEGYDVKYVAVYRSPAGEEVFDDEATVERIVIVEEPDSLASRSQREHAIDELSRILVKESADYFPAPSPVVNRKEVAHAIEAMALEPDLKLRVGRYVAERLPHENPEVQRDCAVRLLVGSSLKEAILPLTELLVYQASWDHQTCCEDPVHHLALTTLREFVANDAKLQYEAARAALSLLSRQASGFYEDIVKTWTAEILNMLANSASTQCDWAREQLKGLGIAPSA